MNELGPRVIIIGAGVSGLALAQGLKKNGIAFHIFEKDPTPEFRPQGYRFRVNSDGASALREVLTTDLFQQFEKICAATVLGFTGIDAMNGEVKPSVPGRGPPRSDPSEPLPYTADRTVTRNLLLVGLEENITFGKRLMRYETGNEEGTVVALFTDGTKAEGSLLVSAEGVRSVIRKQHLPHHTILDTNSRCIYEKTEITAEFSNLFNPNALRNITVISPERTCERPLILFLEPIRFQNNEFRQNLPADYVYWVLATDKSNMGGITDEKLLSLSSKDAAKLSLMLTEEWHPSVRSLLEYQNSDSTSALRIAMTSPDTLVWETSPNVTLMGDAVHVVPPTGALGANTALQDAVFLTRALCKGGKPEDIVDYEEDMKARARVVIERSALGGKHLLHLGDVHTFGQMEL